MAPDRDGDGVREDTAVRDVFGDTTPTLSGIRDIRHLYRTDLPTEAPPMEMPTG